MFDVILTICGDSTTFLRSKNVFTKCFDDILDFYIFLDFCNPLNYIFDGKSKQVWVKSPRNSPEIT